MSHIIKRVLNVLEANRRKWDLSSKASFFKEMQEELSLGKSGAIWMLTDAAAQSKHAQHFRKEEFLSLRA